MSRNISAANLAAAQSGHCHPVTFVRLDLDSGTVRAHDSIGDYIWGSNTWVGVGDFGQVGEMEESEKISPYALDVGLSGIDASFINEALNNDYFGRAMFLYVGWLDDSHDLVADPDEQWAGVIHKMNVNTGQDNRVTVVGESEISIFRKKNGLLFNDQAHQQRYSGDLFFQYQPQMVDAKPEWLGPVRTGQTFAARNAVAGSGIGIGGTSAL